MIDEEPGSRKVRKFATVPENGRLLLLEFMIGISVVRSRRL